MTTTRRLHCSNCSQPLRTLALAGHYRTTVELDVCDPCALIWFDDTETARLAGPGIAELVRTIDAAMRDPGRQEAASLARRQCCPMCGRDLAPVANISRFGRTAQLQCPSGHGYYQTYVLYLAEKGFIRPMLWKDVAVLAGQNKALYCANCGAALPPRPVEHCPCCQSSIGILDPARLASAIDLDQAATPAPAAAPEQAHCVRCGGAVDPTRDLRCPHCQAPLRRDDTGEALAAVEAAAVRARAPRARAAPPPRRLGHLIGYRANDSDAHALFGVSWSPFQVRLLGAAIVLVLLMTFYSAFRQPGTPLRADPSTTPAVVAAFAHTYGAPAMQCAPDAERRHAVRVRTLLAAPAESELAPGNHAASLRAALADILVARREWIAGKPYEELAERYGAPDPAGEQAFIGRGGLPANLERAAFCLPIAQISPVIMTPQGFHLLQVVQAR